jgi:hypothetical protein
MTMMKRLLKPTVETQTALATQQKNRCRQLWTSGINIAYGLQFFCYHCNGQMMKKAGQWKGHSRLRRFGGGYVNVSIART